MKFAAAFRVALRALGRNKLRSSLTMLGIIVGVAAVVAVVAIGHGAERSVQRVVAQMGRNLIMVWPGSTSGKGAYGGAGSVQSLTIPDAEAIARDCPSLVDVVPCSRTAAQVVSGDGNWSTSIQGVTPAFEQVRSWPINKGSYFTEHDVRVANKVCVLGSTVADRIFGSLPPVGQIVRIKNLPFRVVGVLVEKGSSFGSDMDDLVLAPVTTVQKKLMKVTHLNLILASARSEGEVDQALDEVTDLLRQRHRLQEKEDDDFSVGSQQEMAKQGAQFTTIMTMLLASIAAVSLVVGGIGIMNIMLVSVTERTREIGIRMAVGARGKDILTQFLVESAVLSSIGGVIGIGLGSLCAWGVAKAADWPWSVSGGSVALAFTFSAAVGIFFGFYPARKASRLDPIEALRYE